MGAFASPLDLVRNVAPEGPVACVRPELVRRAAAWFQEHFEGDVLYAVKANPSPWALDAVYAGGVRWFDVASEAEIALVASRCPDAQMAFMHPVKSRRAIRRAYFDYGVRVFVLDCEAELAKIVAETDGATDLTLVVRVAVSNTSAGLPLTGKFGASAEDAPALLRATRAVADELGVSFHVGSQCMDPGAYRSAMEHVSRAIIAAGVTVDVVDVGGGFPTPYPGMTPPPLSAYLDVIHDAFEEMPVLMNADLWCEPGRVLVAEGASILTRVELVKGEALYLNDGAYGNLFDAAHCKWPYPMRVHRAGGPVLGEATPFKVYGPTCDSIDVMGEKWVLPGDVSEGDYIEIGLLGAYGTAMQTGFNGFGATEDVEVADAPFASNFAPANVRTPAAPRVVRRMKPRVVKL